MKQTDHTMHASPDGASSGGYRVGTRTDVGLRRQKNEDYLNATATPHGLLLVVCDGMGGHRGGERASRLAVDVCTRTVLDGVGDREQVLRSAVAAAAVAVSQESVLSSEYSGMGTTLVAALLGGGEAVVVNIGDSRAYLLHGGTLRRITHDHSLVWGLVERGEITEEEAERHPQRNVITRSLGRNPDVEPDLFHVRLDRGDALLLSSDGLHGLVRDADIRTSLATYPEPARACDDLVERALAAGGDDNISVVLVCVDDGSPSVESPTDPGGGAQRASGGVGKRGWAWLVLLLLGVAAVLFWALQAEPVGEGVIEPLPDSLSMPAGDSAASGVNPFSSDGDTLIRYDSGVAPGAMEYEVDPYDTIRPGDILRW